MTTATVHTEDWEQMHFVQHFRRTYPGVLIFAVPNGGLRSPSESMRMKCCGVVAGIPDLFIPAWALWIEMKRTKGGKVSPEQVEMIDYLNGIGHTAVVCKGCEAAIAFVTEFVANMK